MRGDVDVSDTKESSENVRLLAQELIRSLDAQSNEHMEHVSADNKLRNQSG
jgi:hypothetical protein